MWWKVYFWIVLILTIIGILSAYGQLKVWSLADWFEIITSVVGFLGLYAYVYKKKILSIQLWRIIFWVTIATWIFNVIYAFTPLEESFPLPSWLSSRTVTNEFELLFAMLITLPMVYAIFKLGQKKR